jgi:drug/metabolite transporter (DMT)-like permease
MPLLPPALTARLTGYLLLFSGMAVVGTYVALTKPLAAVFPVFLLAWLRFGIAAVVMLPWTMPSRRRNWQGATQSPAALSRWREPAERRLLRGLFLQSFFGNFLFSICMLTGVSLTTASAAGVILATLPAVVAMFSWVFLREHLSARVWGAVALAVSGVALLTLARTDAAGNGSVAGNLLVFACVCCEAVYVILGKRLTASLSPIRISALINLIGLALMTPLGLWQALS